MELAQEIFKNKLKSYFINDKLDTVGDGFYEWKIEDWNKISKEDKINSPEFTAQGIKWKLILNPKGIKESDWEYISLTLHTLKFEDPKFKNDYSLHIPVHMVFYVRNYYDYSCYHCCEELPITYLTANSDGFIMSNLIKKTDLNNKVGYSNSSLIKNNKCVFGVYFRIYKYDKAFFKSELANSLYDETETKVVKNETLFEWKIYEWKELFKCEKQYSQKFSLDGHKWQLELYPDGNDKSSRDYVSLFLTCCDPDNDNIHAKFTLFVKNFDDPECSYYIVCDAIFNEKSNSWGFSKFIDRKRLFIKNKSLKKAIIEKQKCVFGVFVQIFEEKNSENEDSLDLLINLLKLGNELNNTKKEIEELEKHEQNETIKRQLRGEIESELVEKMESELREEIESELREEIEKELREKIEKELREKIEKELRSNIEKEIYEKIAKEYSQYQQYSFYYPSPTYYYPQNVPGYQSPPASPIQHPASNYNYPPSTTAVSDYPLQYSTVDSNYQQSYDNQQTTLYPSYPQAYYG